jgi:hypothetical protein
MDQTVRPYLLLSLTSSLFMRMMHLHAPTCPKWRLKLSDTSARASFEIIEIIIIEAQAELNFSLSLI